MLNYEGSCKRIDLIFRSKYPFYSTELYKINDYDYQIFLNEKVDDFDSLLKEYDNSIRFITSPVHLVNKRPDSYLKAIDQIDDSSLAANYEGIPFTLFQLTNHIECQHPNLTVCKIKSDHNNRVIKYFININEFSGAIDKVKETLTEVSPPYGFELTFTDEPKKKLNPPSIFEIVPASSLKNFDPGYLERDERLWFESVNSIYSGDFLKNDLYFYDEKKSKCLLDLSVFSNVNLRNHLLLYDEIFCIFPLFEKMNEFLKDQKLSKDDLIYLISQGRLKVVNTQPEARLDHDFLKECYKTNPDSIVSRRALAMLSAIDIVDIHRNYIFNDMDFIRDIDPILSKISLSNGQASDFLKRILTWPTSAYRSSFDALNGSSTKAIPSFGVNQTITMSMPENVKNKCELEFLTSSEAIHISHALDATYFPYFEKKTGFTDQPFSILMANSLNFYKLSNIQYLSEEQEIFNPERQRNLSMELLSIFDVNDYISISEYLKEIENPLSRMCLNKLFSELSNLPVDERDKIIRSYNEQVEKVLSGKLVAKKVVDLGVDTAGLFIPFLSTGAKAAGWVSKKAKEKVPLFKEITDFVADKAHSANVVKKEVSLLTKINRVARLKRTVV